MILLLLLNILILWMIFYLILKTIIKEEGKKALIIFDDMISHVMSGKKAQQILKDLFTRCRKLNISICFFNTVIFFSTKRCKIKLHTLYFI